MSENVNESRGKTLFQRLFTELLPIEQRALMGTLVFIAIILAVGWVALNEPRRMDIYTAQYEGRSIQRGASIFVTNCSSCHGARGEGIAGVAPALNTPEMFDGTHLAELGWTGTLEDYLLLTVAAGRPARSADWPNPMPTWSQDYGGPMRPDEVEDVVNFILNWGLAYEEGYAEAPAEEAAAPAAPTPEEEEAPTFEPVGTDVTVALPEGDPARGEALFLGTESAPDGAPLGCQACHSLDGSVLVGPSLQGVASRLPEGYESIDLYLHEAIVAPSAHIVPGFEGINMPDNFGERLDAQSLADIIAFLKTQE